MSMIKFECGYEQGPLRSVHICLYQMSPDRRHFSITVDNHGQVKVNGHVDHRRESYIRWSRGIIRNFNGVLFPADDELIVETRHTWFSTRLTLEIHW